MKKTEKSMNNYDARVVRKGSNRERERERERVRERVSDENRRTSCIKMIISNIQSLYRSNLKCIDLSVGL